VLLDSVIYGFDLEMGNGVFWDIIKIDDLVKSNARWLSRKFHIRPAGSALGVQGAAVFQRQGNTSSMPSF